MYTCVHVRIGLLPYVRQLRNMSREQLFICAMETREKQLLAQVRTYVLVVTYIRSKIRLMNLIKKYQEYNVPISKICKQHRRFVGIIVFHFILILLIS